ERAQPIGHGRPGAAGRPPGHTLEVVGIAGGAVAAVLGGGTHGELVHVALARDHRPRLAQPRDDGGVVGRAPAGQDPGRARGGVVGRAQVVLDQHRNALERSRLRRLGAGSPRPAAAHRAHPRAAAGSRARTSWARARGDRAGSRSRRTRAPPTARPPCAAPARPGSPVARAWRCGAPRHDPWLSPAVRKLPSTLSTRVPKRTVYFTSSPASAAATTTPSPKSAWRTHWPTRRPARAAA